MSSSDGIGFFQKDQKFIHPQSGALRESRQIDLICNSLSKKELPMNVCVSAPCTIQCPCTDCINSLHFGFSLWIQQWSNFKVRTQQIKKAHAAADIWAVSSVKWDEKSSCNIWCVIFLSSFSLPACPSHPIPLDFSHFHKAFSIVLTPHIYTWVGYTQTNRSQTHRYVCVCSTIHVTCSHHKTSQ